MQPHSEEKGPALWQEAAGRMTVLDYLIEVRLLLSVGLRHPSRLLGLPWRVTPGKSVLLGHPLKGSLMDSLMDLHCLRSGVQFFLHENGGVMASSHPGEKGTVSFTDKKRSQDRRVSLTLS